MPRVAEGWFPGGHDLLGAHVFLVSCSAEKQTQASATRNGAGGLNPVHRADPSLCRGHGRGPPGLRGHLLPASHLPLPAAGEALRTRGAPRPRCHRRLPGRGLDGFRSSVHGLRPLPVPSASCSHVWVLSGKQFETAHQSSRKYLVTAVSLLCINLTLFSASLS